MKSNYTMELLGLYCISLLILLSPDPRISAQEDNSGTTDSGNQLSVQAIAGIVGLSSIVSGGISAFVNLFLENHRSKKKRKLKDVLNKHLFYKDIIYELERMLSSSRFQKATEPETEVEEKFNEIHKIMRENYLLVDEEIKDEWHNVSGNWREYFQHDPRLRLELAQKVIKLRDLLVKNYNESRSNFAKETGRPTPRKVGPDNWPIEKLNYLKEYIVDYSAQKEH